MARMLNPVTRAYAGPFRGRIRGRKEKRPLIGVTRGRSKIVMLNAFCEMWMRMGNVNGIQCCRIAIYGTNQMWMAFSFAFGGGFGSHPDWPHSHLGKLGPIRPRPLNGLRLVSGFNIRAFVMIRNVTLLKFTSMSWNFENPSRNLEISTFRRFWQIKIRKMERVWKVTFSRGSLLRSGYVNVKTAIIA